MKMDAIDIAGILFLCIDYLIICPILIYYLYIFHAYSKSLHNEVHRSATLVYLINVVIIFSLLFERAFLICSKILNLIHLPIWTVYMFLSLTWIFIMILFIIKVYHLYYKQKYNTSIANMSWRKDINPNDEDWYILNKQTFGNSIFCIKIALIPYILTVLFQTVIPYLLGEELIFFIIDGLIKSILTIIALYIFHATKQLNDIYGIRDELLFQCIGLCISLFLFISIAFIFSYININNDANINRIEWLCHIPISYIISISIGLISTLYPIYFIKGDLMSTKLIPIFTRSNTSNSEFDNEHNPNHPNSSQYMEYIRNSKAMEFVISDYESFKQFMQYLITEFSTENLLFLVELVEIKYSFQIANDNVIRVPRKNLTQPQYYNVFEHCYKMQNDRLDTPKLPTLKNTISSNKNDNNKYIVLDFNHNDNNDDALYSFLFQTDNTVHTKLSISSKLPKSVILDQNDNLLDQMKALYFKYIRSGSMNEINLSYSVRNAVGQFFENSTLKLTKIKSKQQYYKLFNILDECGIEIILLMSQSFQRFIKSDKINQNILNKLIKRNLIDPNNNNNDQVVSFRNADSFSTIKRQRIHSLEYHE